MIEISEFHFTARVEWVNKDGGTVVATFIKGNGARHVLKKAPIQIQDAEEEGGLLLNKLKALYF